MTVRHFVDPVDNKVMREIRERSYKALEELKKAYEARGKKTWLNHWKGDEWMLTIAL